MSGCVGCFFPAQDYIDIMCPVIMSKSLKYYSIILTGKRVDILDGKSGANVVCKGLRFVYVDTLSVHSVSGMML